MKQSLPFLVLLIILSNSLFAQQTKFSRIADSLYRAKDFAQAAIAYQTAADSSRSNAMKKTCFYNAACCYALVNDTSKAVSLLNKAVYQFGYKSTGMLQDGDLVSIHQTKDWKKIKSFLDKQQQKLSNPKKAQLITTDIHNFWKAYDAAKKDTANMQSIFQKEYFDKATPGFEDYIATKIGSIEKFVANQKSKPLFYAAIRNNTLSIDKMKGDISNLFVKFKKLYAAAIFPDIYFVIGRFNSAGTVSDNGLLLGVDQISKSNDIPLQELNLWESKGIRNVRDLPIIVAHELIHSQQNSMRQDTTLISYAIQEGMADFFAELLTGVNPSQRQYDFAKDRKKKIWNDFAAEMYLNRYNNWIANGDQETPDHPSDLGYYIGYEICKSYYDEMPDKKQAIIDMFHISDYKDFLKKSKYEEKMNALP